jgi:ParB-like chromosome segregation protein Spo0J
MRKIRLPLNDILLVREVKDLDMGVQRYKAIVMSLKEIGLVEPLVVLPQKGNSRKYLLLDGRLRFFALQELGETAADCVVVNNAVEHREAT